MKKTNLSKDIKYIISRIFESDVVSLRKISSAHINMLYEAKLKGTKKSLILKMYNEDWKAEKEAFVYRDIRAHIDIPVPIVYITDDSKKLLPYAYNIMSKMEGMQIDKSYKKYGNKRLFKQAGEVLSKLHHIRFHKYGWLYKNQINPAFNRWRDFVWYDVEQKLSKLKKVKKVMRLIGDIEDFLNKYDAFLDVTSKPSLLHKDFHCSHILTNRKEVTGIVDTEWAMAGHSEFDFMKMELWVFNRFKGIKNAFYNGYSKHGHISHNYPERKKLYELLHWVNMINISNEISNRVWLEHNIQQLKKFLK